MKKKKTLFYGWIVLIIIFLALVIAQGFKVSFGAFIEPWERDFELTRGGISLMALYGFIIFALAQPFSGASIDRFGSRVVISFSLVLIGVSSLLIYFSQTYWQLYVWYGLLTLGFSGVSLTPVSLAITHWFVKRRGLAIGLLISGASMGQMVVVPLSLLLIGQWGWKPTILFFSLATLIFLPIVILLVRSHPRDKGLQPYGVEPTDESAESSASHSQGGSRKKGQRLPWTVMLRRREFLFLAIPYFVCGMTTLGLIDTHFIPLAHEHGLSTPSTGLIVSILAATNIVGTILSGQAADVLNIRRLLGLLYILRFVSFLILLNATNFTWFIVFGALFGITNYATIAPTTIMATTYFKNYSPGLVVGYLTMCHMFGAGFGAYIPGLIHDSTGNYVIALMMGLLGLVIASTLSFLLPEKKPIVLPSPELDRPKQIPLSS